jgi:pectate lyase
MKLPFVKLAALALLGALPAGAAVPGFAGNITGGGNATPIVVNSFTAMQSAMNSYTGTGGLVLHYTGTFDEAPILANICGQWSKPRTEININNKSGVTILGMDGSSANFAIRIRGSSNNIIIRNMKMGLVPGGGDNGDIVGIEAESHHVWFDHNELYSRNVSCPGTPGNDTTFDGALDIKASATNITVSYNYFHDHAKVGLDGSGDSDDFERRITYAHNRYENVGSRLPLQRFGFIHVYNNYYNGITESGINVRMTGHALIENNWFENALNPVTSRTSDELGDWDLRNNNAQSAADNARYNLTWNVPGSTPYRNADNWQTTATFPITLPYTYTTYPAEVSKCIAINAAGVGKGLREAPAVLGLCGGGTTNNLTVSPTSLSFAAVAGSSPVSVTANVGWTVSDDQSWLSTAPTTGSNNGSFSVSASANSSSLARSGTVTVSGGGITRTVAVTQAGQTQSTLLAVIPESINFSATGATATGAISSNVSWTITDNQSWLAVSPASGSGNGNFTVTATTNTGMASRGGTVTVSGGGITRTVLVGQAGVPTTSAVYQTENGIVGGGTVLETKNGGFAGTGYVNASSNGGFSQNSNIDGRGSPGTRTLRIRYALASGTRTGRLLVNGVAQNITFNSTGSWTTWALMNVTVALNNNATNTIRFESTGQDLANIDQIEIL